MAHNLEPASSSRVPSPYYNRGTSLDEKPRPITPVLASHHARDLGCNLPKASPWPAWTDSWISHVDDILLYKIVRASASLGHFLLPSFITKRTRKPATNCGSTITSLDGLRGLACLFVFVEHMTKPISEVFYKGYGEDPELTYFLQLPFLRLPWSGHSMVDIFFTISGYVLSVKALGCMQSDDMATFTKTVTSALIRRGIRLYLPVVTAITATGILAWLHGFEAARAIQTQYPESQNTYQELPPSLPLLDQISDIRQALWLSFVAYNPGPYGEQLWTIPVELRGSLMLFLLLVGVARLKPPLRMLTTVVVGLYAASANVRVLFGMIGGMFLADIDLMSRDHSDSCLTGTFEPRKLQPMPETSSLGARQLGCRLKTALRRLAKKEIMCTIILTLGLYLCSITKFGGPSEFGMQWPLKIAATLNKIMMDPMPENNLIRGCGAILVTWVAANGKWFKSVLTAAPCVYLGRISFALYVVHYVTLKTIEIMVLKFIHHRIWGVPGPHECTVNQVFGTWIMTLAVVLPITLWLADVFWRAVDLPSVRFARWTETQVVRSP